jgi:pimeloyl-ACP methyl ester carboxylesterase
MPVEPLAFRTVTRADRRIAFSEIGDPDGYPVLWCHGGLSSRIDIELAGDGLQGLGVRVITVDRPGIGESDRRKGHAVADWPADAVAVADELGIESFAVAGWSAGGPYALACAAALPSRVTAVATIGGMAPIRSHADVRELGLAVDRILIPLSRRAPWLAAGAFSATRRLKPERLKHRTIGSLPAPDRALLDPLPADVAVGYAIAALRHGVHGTVDDYCAFGGDWGFALADVRAPVRCWRGTEDSLLPRSATVRVIDALPQATMHEVPASGHFVFVTHAAEIFGGLLEDARA